MNKLAFFLLAFFLISCKNEYQNLGNDLYEKKGNLFIYQKAKWSEKKGDSNVLEYYDSLCVFNNKQVYLNKIVDIPSFKKGDKYYFDKNYIYVHNSTPAFFPALNAIKSDSKFIQFLGYDYYKVDNKIYFQSLEVKNANPKTFIVTDSASDGYYYGKDDSNFFYKAKQIQKR
ncbi:hypothetical protein [Chryseobacterium mucoviscidosis]|uniref:hypothetical protein n=1 Tax=Chryseobacterium mucoviscidosis TaxID=1945581 RepID=UPI0031DC1324